MVDKFSHMRFEPSGFTKNSQIPIAKSLVDYIFRYLASRFLTMEDQDAVGIIQRDDVKPPLPVAGRAQGAADKDETSAARPELKVIAPAPKENGNGGSTKVTFVVDTDAPACSECGSITVRSGSCYKCMNCGATTGCS